MKDLSKIIPDTILNRKLKRLSKLTGKPINLTSLKDDRRVHRKWRNERRLRSTLSFTREYFQLKKSIVNNLIPISR